MLIDLVNKSVCEIPMDESAPAEQKNVELLEIRDSDDEGPLAIPITKSVENHFIDYKDGKHDKDSKAGITPTKTSNIANCENRQRRNYNKSNQHSRDQHGLVNNNQASGQDIVQVARKSSLLEKLLADDIRHERNVILQCIRHIVKNNFFEIQSKCLK